MGDWEPGGYPYDKSVKTGPEVPRGLGEKLLDKTSKEPIDTYKAKLGKLISTTTPQGFKPDQFDFRKSVESATLATAKMIKDTGMPAEMFPNGEASLDAYDRYQQALDEVRKMKSSGKRVLDEDDIHKIAGLVSGDAAYRNEPVSVTLTRGEKSGDKWEFPQEKEVPMLMSELLTWQNDAILSGAPRDEVGTGMKEALVRIHPIPDANGRLASVISEFYTDDGLQTSEAPNIDPSPKEEEHKKRQPESILEIGPGDNVPYYYAEMDPEAKKGLGVTFIDNKPKGDSFDKYGNLAGANVEHKYGDAAEVLADPNSGIKEKSFDKVRIANVLGVPWGDYNPDEKDNRMEDLLIGASTKVAPGGEITIIETYTPPSKQKVLDALGKLGDDWTIEEVKEDEKFVEEGYSLGVSDRLSFMLRVKRKGAEVSAKSSKPQPEATPAVTTGPVSQEAQAGEKQKKKDIFKRKTPAEIAAQNERRYLSDLANTTIGITDEQHRRLIELGDNYPLVHDPERGRWRGRPAAELLKIDPEWGGVESVGMDRPVGEKVFIPGVGVVKFWITNASDLARFQEAISGWGTSFQGVEFVRSDNGTLVVKEGYEARAEALQQELFSDLPVEKQQKEIAKIQAERKAREGKNTPGWVKFARRVTDSPVGEVLKVAAGVADTVKAVGQATEVAKLHVQGRRAGLSEEQISKTIRKSVDNGANPSEAIRELGGVVDDAKQQKEAAQELAGKIKAAEENEKRVVAQREEQARIQEGQRELAEKAAKEALKAFKLQAYFLPLSEQEKYQARLAGASAASEIQALTDEIVANRQKKEEEERVKLEAKRTSKQLGPQAQETIKPMLEEKKSDPARLVEDKKQTPLKIEPAKTTPWWKQLFVPQGRVYQGIDLTGETIGNADDRPVLTERVREPVINMPKSISDDNNRPAPVPLPEVTRGPQLQQPDGPVVGFIGDILPRLNMAAAAEKANKMLSGGRAPEISASRSDDSGLLGLFEKDDATARLVGTGGQVAKLVRALQDLGGKSVSDGKSSMIIVPGIGEPQIVDVVVDRNAVIPVALGSGDQRVAVRETVPNNPGELSTVVTPPESKSQPPMIVRIK